MNLIGVVGGTAVLRNIGLTSELGYSDSIPLSLLFPTITFFPIAFCPCSGGAPRTHLISWVGQGSLASPGSSSVLVTTHVTVL